MSDDWRAWRREGLERRELLDQAGVVGSEAIALSRRGCDASVGILQLATNRDLHRLEALLKRVELSTETIVLLDECVAALLQRCLLRTGGLALGLNLLERLLELLELGSFLSKVRVALVCGGERLLLNRLETLEGGQAFVLRSERQCGMTKAKSRALTWAATRFSSAAISP